MVNMDLVLPDNIEKIIKDEDKILNEIITKYG
jgi:hypothetical protein